MIATSQFSKLVDSNASDGEAPAHDMTLIHELAALVIANGETPPDTAGTDEADDLRFEDPDFDLEESSTMDVGAFTGGLDGLKAGYFAENQTDLKRGQVEMLLEALGGTASLPEFMRNLANVRGYRRVGRLIRKSLQSEITALRRKGRIAIENGRIRLP